MPDLKINLPQYLIDEIKVKDKKGLFIENIFALENSSFKTKPPLIGLWPNSITTINNTIWLPRNFKSWSRIDQESTLIHESVHLIQYKNGLLNIIQYGLNKEYRLRVEVSAERIGIRYRIAMGDLRKSQFPNYSVNQANNWPNQYNIAKCKTHSEWFILFKSICDEELKIVEA